MGEAVKLRETTEYIERQVPREAKRKARNRALRQAKREVKGKTFAELTVEQKDDLLKASGIALGIISE